MCGKPKVFRYFAVIRIRTHPLLSAGDRFGLWEEMWEYFAMGKPSATAVKAESRPGRHGDGDGLFLMVSATGAKSWVCRVQKNGRRRDIGLGSAAKVPLAQARKRADEVRGWMEMGLDPVFEKRKARGIPTFKEAAAKVYAATHKTWRNQKHEWQWGRTLEQFVYPTIGNVSVAEVTGPMVRNVLAEIWLSKPETARRVRQRIGAVLDWAYASGYRETEAPMRSITKGLPRQPRAAGHYVALPYSEMAGFLAKLRERETLGRLALEFAILTAARSGEVRKAEWSEFDLKRKLWTIPGERMKSGREHVVPLAPAAMRVLDRCEASRGTGSSLVFPSPKPGQALSDMTLMKVLRDMKITATVHGFRSSFRDWVSEATDHQGELAEAALAHAVKDKTEAAYRRGTLLEKRRRLMEDWDAFCHAV
ncbi:site-specific integrase [Sphingomonas oligophenolica]|uniref:Integrase arm-type DNA-binding domain-containing protein n=1 Tax=Sphingomonas oligophenolica TaxID=301154 RepID=A0ABU9YCE3_9SPHN